METVLIVGCGSIGRRHARNLRTLGMQDIALCDPSTARRKALAEELRCSAYADLPEALEAKAPAIVFVCSPTKFHMPQALAAARCGCHLFIEKPLSHTLEGIEELQREVAARNLVCMVGCNMRFHFGPSTVKRLLEEGTLGTVRHAHVVTASYLPDWRPEQDYRKSYSADPMQGGAILDCIHELDLALWYLGPATLLDATTAPAASLGIPVEGTADLALQHESGAQSDVHLSFMEKEHRRSCMIEGGGGTVAWSIDRRKVDVTDASGTVVSTFNEPEGYDLNQMYLDELRHFLACVEERRTPENSLSEAIPILRIALQAKTEATVRHPSSLP